MTHRSTWKQGEQRVADLFGTTRTPLSGGNSKHTRSDTLHPRLFIEVKLRQVHTTWTLFRQTELLARKEGKVPILALQEKGRHGCLLVMRPQDVAAVYRELKGKEGGTDG